MPSRPAQKRRGKAPKAKQLVVLLDTMSKAESMVFADLSQIKVKDLTKLRTDLRKAGGKLIISKNRLIQRALKETGNPDLGKALKGPTAVAFGIGNPALPAKAILDLLKDEEKKLTVKAGILDKAAVSAEGVKEMATIPGKPELIGRLLGSISAPPQKVVFALHQASSKLVYAFAAIQRQKEAAEGGAAPAA